MVPIFQDKGPPTPTYSSHIASVYIAQRSGPRGSSHAVILGVQLSPADLLLTDYILARRVPRHRMPRGDVLEVMCEKGRGKGGGGGGGGGSVQGEIF